VNSFVSINNLVVDRSYYKPGEPVTITAELKRTTDTPQKVEAVLTIYSLMSQVHQESMAVKLEGAAQAVSFTFQPATVTPRGYGIELAVMDKSGNVLAADSTAFDVLQNWTQNPRYGFLTDFYPERADGRSTMAELNRYHINGLQFYDWMYRHEQFLTEEDLYYDQWSPKPKSLQTVNDLIAAAHKYGMAAMPYTAIYGSSRDFALLHPEMVLYRSNGEMHDFGGDKMMIMDPRPASPWTAHLMAQFKEVLDNTGFDGIHIDQYGDPKVGYDQNRKSYNLAPAIVDFVNQTKQLTDQYSTDDAVVFNLVNNWPVEDIAPSNEDFVYIEVWEPNTWFTDLHSLIVNAQRLSNGKPVVLACYIDPTFEVNAVLNDAVIFASGGGHIELGENNGMLAEAYFPSYRVISAQLATTLQDYYDFAVRYQNVIGPETIDVTGEYQPRVTIPGVSTSLSQMANSIWPFVRESTNSTAVNLINFRGVDQVEWNKRVPERPVPIRDFQLTVETGERKALNVWFATPDQPKPGEFLKFVQQSGILTITVPSLDYWSMVVIDWE
jgi:dextranase